MARGLIFGFRKKRDCTIRVAKTKTLISFAVTAMLICVFVFAYAKSRFSHDEANMGGDVAIYNFKFFCLDNKVALNAALLNHI